MSRFSIGAAGSTPGPAICSEHIVPRFLNFAEGREG